MIWATLTMKGEDAMGAAMVWVRGHLLPAAFGALVLGLGLGGCGKPAGGGAGGGAAAASGPGSASSVPEVGVMVLQPERIAVTTELPGRVSAFLMAEVRPQVSGIIRERLFEEGAGVKAGDALYVIAPESYQTVYANAEAAVAVAKANQGTSAAAVAVAKAALATVQATRDVAKAALAGAKAAQSRAEANAVPLRLRAERFRELAASKAVSQQDLDDACAALKQAEAAIEGTRAGTEGTQAEVVRTEAAIHAAEADVQKAMAAAQGTQAAIGSAEAGLEAARITLGYTRITAPISGRIGRSAVTVGALATAHQPIPFATIQQIDPIYVDAPQSTASLLRLRQRLASGSLARDASSRTKVGLVLEDGTPYAAEGTLEFSDVTVDPTTASVTLRMVFPNPDGVLLPGMFVRAVITEGVGEQAILVPQQAVTRDAKGKPAALVVGPSETLQQRPVTLDRAMGDRWLVVSGLAAGDRVVMDGMQKARPGMTVKAVPFVGAASPGAAPAAPSAPSTAAPK